MSNINTQSSEILELVQVFSDNVCQSVVGSGWLLVIFFVFSHKTDLRHGTSELAANPVEVLAAVAQARISCACTHLYHRADLLPEPKRASQIQASVLRSLCALCARVACAVAASSGQGAMRKNPEPALATPRHQTNGGEMDKPPNTTKPV